jgi:hypothetical protein
MYLFLPLFQTNSHESKIISEVLKRQEELIKHLQNIQTKVTDLKLELTNASSSSKPSAAKSEKPTGSAQAKPPKKQVLKSQNNNISSPSEPQINTQVSCSTTMFVIWLLISQEKKIGLIATYW